MTLSDKYNKPMQVLVTGTGHSGANFTIRVLDKLGYPCGKIIDSRHGNDNPELFKAAHGDWNIDVDNIPPVVKSHNFGTVLYEWIKRGYPKPEYVILCYRDPEVVQRRVNEEDGTSRTDIVDATILHNAELNVVTGGLSIGNKIPSSQLDFPSSGGSWDFYNKVYLFRMDSISFEEFEEAHKKIYNPEWAKGEKW
jgi:hypothetical protein